MFIIVLKVILCALAAVFFMYKVSEGSDTAPRGGDGKRAWDSDYYSPPD